MITTQQQISTNQRGSFTTLKKRKKEKKRAMKLKIIRFLFTSTKAYYQNKTLISYNTKNYFVYKTYTYIICYTCIICQVRMTIFLNI